MMAQFFVLYAIAAMFAILLRQHTETQALKTLLIFWRHWQRTRSCLSNAADNQRAPLPTSMIRLRKSWLIRQ